MMTDTSGKPERLVASLIILNSTMPDSIFTSLQDRLGLLEYGKIYTYMVRRKKTKNPKNLVLVALAVLLIVGAGAWLLKRHYTSKKAPPITATTSSPANQPTESTTGPTSTKATPGGVVDKNGQTTGALPPASQWTTSASGNITLQQPTAGSLVQTGDTLSGLAKVATVQFILTDNSVGLI